MDDLKGIWRITGGPASALAPENLHVAMPQEQSPPRKLREKSRLRRIFRVTAQAPQKVNEYGAARSDSGLFSS
jgi:hypothetical protein